jgi:hypothetical protein
MSYVVSPKELLILQPYFTELAVAQATQLIASSPKFNSTQPMRLTHNQARQEKIL